MTAAEQGAAIAAFENARSGSSDAHRSAHPAFEAWRARLRGRRGSVRRLEQAEGYLRAARAAFAAGFQDAAERYAGEFLAHWNRLGRPRAGQVSSALNLIHAAAENRHDTSLAMSAKRASERYPR